MADGAVLSRSVTFRLSLRERTAPSATRTCPAGNGSTCCPSVTSGFGKRFTIPSSIMALAPSPISSPGWNTAMTVPRHLSLFAVRFCVAPMSQVTCRSCPQECAMAVSRPDAGSVPVFLLA